MCLNGHSAGEPPPLPPPVPAQVRAGGRVLRVERACTDRDLARAAVGSEMCVHARKRF